MGRFLHFTGAAEMIRSPALTFVLVMGIVNLSGDVTYEGGASIAMGLPYEQSRPALIVFVVAAQLASVPLFLLGRRQERRGPRDSTAAYRRSQT